MVYYAQEEARPLLRTIGGYPHGIIMQTNSKIFTMSLGMKHSTMNLPTSYQKTMTLLSLCVLRSIVVKHYLAVIFCKNTTTTSTNQTLHHPLYAQAEEITLFHYAESVWMDMQNYWVPPHAVTHVKTNGHTLFRLSCW